MRKLLIVTIMALICAASPAVASIMSYNFTFSGGGATASGNISFDMAILNAPGRYLYDPSNSTYSSYGGTNSNFVTALTVKVTGDSGGGDGTYSLADFDGILFDTSTGVNFNQALFGQVLAGAGPGGIAGTWGDGSAIIPASSPLQSYYGDFQLFSLFGNPNAPTGSSPFEMATLGGQYMQLTSFTPSTATPEPGTIMLLGSGVLAFGVSRFRRRKESRG